MKNDTNGRRLLAGLLRTGGGALTTRQVANAVRSSSGMVSQWAKGSRRPGPIFRKALAARYAIAADDWLTEDERERERAFDLPEHRTAEG